MRRIVLGVLGLVAAVGVGVWLHGSAQAATCTTTIHDGANVATALGTVTSGGTLCLDAGTYNYTTGAVTKTSMTTVMPAPGVMQSEVTIHYMTMYASRNVTFQNVTIEGADIGEDGGQPAANMQFNAIHWTSCVIVRQATSAMLNIVFDGGVADVSSTNEEANASPCLDDGRFYIRGYNTSYVGDRNLVIKNMDFPGSNCTDGIELVGESNGWTIGPGNTFHGILQNSPTACLTHTDPIQFFGSNHGLVNGNYFYNNTDGILSSNGNGNNMTITNNVFGTNGDGYPYAVIDCGDSNVTYDHNVFMDDALYLCYSSADVGNIGPTTATTVTNNYMPGGFQWNGQSAFTGTTADYNMRPGGTGLGGGIHNVNGTATFIHGSSPSSYADFAFSSASAGNTSASDGGAIGIRVSSDALLSDLDDDGDVDQDDLDLLKADYGKTTGLTTAGADINADGRVNIIDLSILLKSWTG